MMGTSARIVLMMVGREGVLLPVMMEGMAPLRRPTPPATPTQLQLNPHHHPILGPDRESRLYSVRSALLI